jgi:hypothetical protein
MSGFVQQGWNEENRQPLIVELCKQSWQENLHRNVPIATQRPDEGQMYTCMHGHLAGSIGLRVANHQDITTAVRALQISIRSQLAGKNLP